MLYNVVQEKAPLVEASMKRHILAAAFDQGQFRQRRGEPRQADQQISN